MPSFSCLLLTKTSPSLFSLMGLVVNTIIRPPKQGQQQSAVVSITIYNTNFIEQHICHFGPQSSSFFQINLKFHTHRNLHLSKQKIAPCNFHSIPGTEFKMITLKSNQYLANTAEDAAKRVDNSWWTCNLTPNANVRWKFCYFISPGPHLRLNSAQIRFTENIWVRYG